MFTIQAGTTVAISDMSITVGSAPQGGGIDSLGSLTLERDQVVGNSADWHSGGSGSGGGVYSAGALTISDSSIANNQATEHGGGVAAGSATLTRDLIANNKLTGAAAGPSIGGGVYGAGMSLTADTIVGNQVVDGAAIPLDLAAPSVSVLARPP